MRFLSRVVFRTYHMGVGRYLVVEHTLGSVLASLAFTAAIIGGAFYLCRGL